MADQFESTYENPSPSNFSEQNQESLDLIKETIEDLFDSNLLSEGLVDELSYYLDCVDGVIDEEEIDDDYGDGFDDYDYDKGLVDVD